MRALAFAAGVLLLAGCTTYLLGPADRASVHANESLDHRVYCELEGVDAGYLRVESKTALRNDLAILRRSGETDDGGAMECP